jgi:UDP-N-acetylmuramoyl-tripeptide--D-alanyl-D-alanine ligase
VAQREHYLPGSCLRFALRWWSSEAGNVALALCAVAALALSVLWPLVAVATAVAVTVAPLHLNVRGRTSRLVLTRRLRALAGVWLALQALVVLAGALLGVPAVVSAAGAVLVPLLVDAALALTAPVERRMLGPYVGRAAARLGRVAPTIVAVTGSYGKTSTKNHIAQLLSGTRTVVVSPASFNNRAGLARAVNEHLAEGTEVFVAEMGTYGPGEIADLCAWCPPEVAVLTAIGPVHLERFGSEDRIVEAKAEIAASASVVVVNGDDSRLAALAERIERARPEATVLRCSAQSPSASVCVQQRDDCWSVAVDGAPVADGVPAVPGVQPTNLACALAVALHLGLGTGEVAERLHRVTATPNRLSIVRTPSGLTVIDDTFNANPAGARAALQVLQGTPVSRRRTVVTPGMVELGPRQAQENEAFGRAASAVATDLVVVGRTNRRALVKGAQSLAPVVVRTREEAVRWVRTHLGIDDAVLYENDLPDHYP